MAIKEINYFKSGGTIERPNKTPKILLENKKSKKPVAVLGGVLEAQYSVEDNFLILTTEGNPFEEALYIYYFSNGMRLMDFLELSAMYAEGMLRRLSIAGSNSVEFSFFDADDEWVLEVFSKPKYAFFGNEYPVKRRLSIFRKAWLSLKPCGEQCAK